jgi:hypothetical protein
LAIPIDEGMMLLDTTNQEKYKISLFLCTFSNFENSLLANEIIMIMKNGEDQGVIEEMYRGGEDKQGRPNQI